MRVIVVRTRFPEASRPGSLKVPEVPDILQHPQQEENKNNAELTLLNGDTHGLVGSIDQHSPPFSSRGAR